MELLILIGLIVVGLALIALEVTVVPGFNVVGVLGVLGTGFGVVYAFMTFGPGGGLVALLVTIASAVALFYLLWQSGAWDRFILSDSLRRDSAADAAADETRSGMLGRTGRAVTPLRPGGVIEVDGARVEVETEGAFVASGSEVRVVAMDRRRFIVRPVE